MDNAALVYLLLNAILLAIGILILVVTNRYNKKAVKEWDEMVFKEINQIINKKGR